MIIFIAMLPHIIKCKGVFEYYADFNAQQLFFYETCIKAIQNGETAWNWYTDLGVNFVGSYSFYTLGSPFFWLTVLFPANWSRYFLAPLLATKFGLSSMFAYAYIRRFVKKPQSAFIGGLLYAFSGFSLYNIVFNHFHEVICFFPLLLIALEEAVVNKRRGVFALAVALSALVNYFFFFGECVFLIIYFISRMIGSSEFRIKVKDFFCLAFESISGVMISGVLLLPSALAVSGSYKTGIFLNGMNFLFYEISEYYGKIIKSLFYVSSIGGIKTFFPHIDHNWDSAAMYLPLFAMVGVIAFFFCKKKHWAKILLAICLVMAFIPGFNAAFTMFNGAYYARWFFMPSLICSMVTVYALENADISCWKKGVAVDGMVIAIMSLLLIFHPVDRTYDETNEFGDEVTIPTFFPCFMTEISLDYIYGLSILTAVILLALYIIIRNRRSLCEQKTMRTLTVAVIVCCLGLSCATVWAGRGRDEIDIIYGDYMDDTVVIEDDSVYRVDIRTPGASYNMNMAWDMYSSRSFNSIVPSSLYEIYDLLQTVPRTEATLTDNRYIAQHALLGTKYFIIHEDFISSDDDTTAKEAINADLQGCVIIDKQDEYYIVENTYAIPMGYAYDEYILARDTEDKVVETFQGPVSYVDRILVECVALMGDQVEKYNDILTEIPVEETEVSTWTYERLAEASAARNAAGVEEFSFGKNSFHAKTAYDIDELVVFSVPYDEGWSAEIDGVSAEYDKVNGGFIALRVPAGEHNIDFTYTTPGLKAGIIITITGVALLAAWIVLWYVILKKGVQRRSGDVVSAHAAYIDMASNTANSEEK